MAFNLKSDIDPVHVPIRPLKGMVTDVSSSMLTPGNFYDLSNYWVTKKGIKKRNGFTTFATNTTLPLEDQPIISIAPVWKTDGNQFAAVLTSRFLYTLTGYSFSEPVYWSYNTGLCSVSGTTVTGYGTDWNNTSNYLLPGDYITFTTTGSEQMEYGDCESTNSPQLDGFTALLVQGEWARSNLQTHGGSYSWRLYTVGSVTSASAILVNPVSATNMHGLIAGGTYNVDLWLWSEANPVSTGLVGFYEYIEGAWYQTYSWAPSANSVWENLTGTITLNANTTGTQLKIELVGSQVENTALYLDDISFIGPIYETEEIVSINDHNTLTTSAAATGVGTPTDHIENGDCESTNSPTLDGGTSGLADGTWARSTTQKKGGLYSWVLTKTAAAGVNPAIVYLTDNTNTADMHGLTAGTTYLFSLWGFTDAAALVSSTVKFQEYYGGAWNDSVTFTCSAASTWESLSQSVTLNAGTTGVTIEVRIDTAEIATKVLYIDDISFVESGLIYEIRRSFNVDDTILLDWTVADGKLIIADHTRPLYAYDGTTFSIYAEAVTYIPACVTFFSDRLWIGNIIEEGSYYFQRIRWSSPTNRTSFNAADYTDLPYTASPIRRLVPLGRYLAVYFDDAVFLGSPSNIPNSPYVFRQIDTGNRGLLGVRAVTVAEGGHLFAAWDDIYFFNGQGVKPINCPVAEEMIGGCQDPRRIYIVTDHKNDRVVFGFPSTGRYINRLWSFHYRTNSWSYDNITATSIANPALDLGLTWDDLASFLPIDTWDEGMGIFTSWDSIGNIVVSNTFYKMESGSVQQLSDDSGSDANSNFTTVWTTGDLDFNQPDKDKTFLKLHMKLQNRPSDDVTFSIAVSYNGGYSWQQLGQLVITSGTREAKIDFLVTGSALRFRAVETSSVFGYEITEIGLTVRGRGYELEFD